VKPLYLAAFLCLAALPASAQQPDPAQAFAKEWGALQAADTLAASSHEHVAELAQKLVADHQRIQRELVDANNRATNLDVYLRACGDKPGCTVAAPQ
jgi:predicted outer membrane protein